MKTRSTAVAAGGGVLATAALLVLALVLQHHRHGWPFSLHHGLPAAEAPASAAPSAAAPDPHARHARAPISLDAAGATAGGVTIARVQREVLSEPVVAVATAVPDEARVSHVHTRVAGWVEVLRVNTTGQKVRAGQTLAGIFSQELLSSQNEYLLARRGPGMEALVEAARNRLGVLGMTEAEIRELERTGTPRRLVTIAAPRGGVVLHRGIAAGTAVDPSTELLTIADLSVVWVLAEVPEGDIARVAVGAPATLDFPATGRPPLQARVAFLYPTLTERTRTVRVRFEVPNADGALRPGLYGTATFHGAPREALTVPRDALVETGEAAHVFVVSAEGRYEPRTVRPGQRLKDRVEVRDGLAEGESVVASGVFLIDSESRLRASGGAGTGHSGHGGGRREPAPGTSAPSAAPSADEHGAHEHPGG